MGKSDLGSRPFSFNGSIEVKAVDESVRADAGALLMRELMERTGLVRWLEEHLIDDRRPGSVSHSVGSLLRAFLLLIARGHSDQDHADRLRSDLSLRASARDTRGIADEGCPASQPTLSRFLGMLSGEENLAVLRQGVLKNGIRRLRQALCADPGAPGVPDWVTIDIDDVPLLVHGNQPGSGYNAYVGHECYHASSSHQARGLLRTLGLPNMGRAVFRRLLGVSALRFGGVHVVAVGEGQEAALGVHSDCGSLDISGRLLSVRSAGDDFYHSLSLRFQSLRSGCSQMFFLVRAHSCFVS